MQRTSATVRLHPGVSKRGKRRHALWITHRAHVHCFSGLGTWLHWENGHPLRYDGGWLDDMEHGSGVLHHVHADLGGVTIRGTFHRGEMEGEATWTLDSGHVYFQGQMYAGGFTHGRLNSIDPPGETYQGSFEDQRYQGQAIDRKGTIEGVPFDAFRLTIGPCSPVCPGLGCLRQADGSFFYGHFAQHDRSGPGVTILMDTNDTHTSVHADTRFRIFPAIYKHGHIHARWRRRDESQEASTVTQGDESAETQTNRGEMWSYMRHIIADGLKAVIRLHYDCHQSCGCNIPTEAPSVVSAPVIGSNSSPPSDEVISAIISSHLAAFSSCADFQLLSIPMTIFHAVKHRVCTFRVSDEAGCPTQPYLCETCAQRDRDNTWEVCQVTKGKTEWAIGIVTRCVRLASSRL